MFLIIQVNMKYNQKLLFYFFAGLYLLLTFACRNHIFFGDMVQFASRHPHFFLENNFNTIYLPNNLDSGHPPLFGIYIAFTWLLFGKSLIVSHFAMVPFLLVIAYQVPKLLSRWLSGTNLFFASILILIEPTLLAQSLLVSPDVVLMALFITAINLYLDKKYYLLAFILIPLGLISLRGMMVLFAAFLSIVLSNWKSLNFINELKQTILYFTPAVAIAFTWLYLHYQHSGWIGFHSDSPWASSFQRVSSFQMLKNAFLFAWRLVDFGRIALLILAIVFFWKGQNIYKSNRSLTIAILVFIVVFAMNTLFADGLVGHRYYLPIYFLMLLFVLKNSSIVFPNHQFLTFLIIFSSFLIGSILVYPKKVAMGWDATPAHIPYYCLRANAIDFLNEKNIPLAKVASGFPNLDSREILELNGDTSRFISYADSNSQYILYSNIFNFPDELIDQIECIKPIYYQKSGGVFIGIYPLK
ncbi:MAG: hypothetical protein RI952_200 [Bacteroidota bacterium]